MAISNDLGAERGAHTDRRTVLAAAAAGVAAAATATATPGWAAAGGPTHLGAAKLASGEHVLVGVDGAGDEVFRLPIPDRGHAAAAHPTRPLAVAFARRPGTFGVVVDCARGAKIADLQAPEGSHFYGHGCFSPEGDVMYAPENDYENASGRIGVWDAATWQRIDALPCGGIGPHDCLPVEDGILAIANGGIVTHPAMGRQKLNLPTMRPNLAYLEIATGRILEIHEPQAQMASLRHIAMREDGLVAAAMQWEGAALEAPAILALHRRGEKMRFLRAPDGAHERMKGYAGSVTFSGDGSVVAITSPRGGAVQVFDVETGAFLEMIEARDVCGAAACGAGLLFSDGLGFMRWFGSDLAAAGQARSDLAWDNHLAPVQGAA